MNGGGSTDVNSATNGTLVLVDHRESPLHQHTSSSSSPPQQIISQQMPSTSGGAAIVTTGLNASLTTTAATNVMEMDLQQQQPGMNIKLEAVDPMIVKQEMAAMMNPNQMGE